MTKEVPEHIQRHRVGRASAALPGWAAAEFTESKAAVMRVVGVEMANNRGVCALHIKAIAAAAGVSVETARSALRTAKMIGLVTVERTQNHGCNDESHFHDGHDPLPSYGPRRLARAPLNTISARAAWQLLRQSVLQNGGLAIQLPRRRRSHATMAW